MSMETGRSNFLANSQVNTADWSNSSSTLVLPSAVLLPMNLTDLRILLVVNKNPQQRVLLSYGTRSKLPVRKSYLRRTTLCVSLLGMFGASAAWFHRSRQPGANNKHPG